MTFAVPSATLVTSVTRVTAGQPPWLPTLPTPWLCPEDRIVHNDINACTMITDSAVNTIRYGIQLPRLEESNRNVVYSNTPIVATSTNIINDGESRAPRRRSSDSRTSRAGACGEGLSAARAAT